MRRSRAILVCVMVVSVAPVLSLPDLARAEQAGAVECPTCWRMIAPGPCRCPHCQARLPGRECPPPSGEDRPAAPAPRREEEGPAKVETPERRPGSDEQDPVKRRPAKRRVSTPAVDREDRPASAHTEGDRAPAKRRPAKRRPTTSAEDREARPARERTGTDGGRRRGPPEERRGEGRGDETEGEGEGEGESREDRLRRGPSLLVGYRYYGLIDWTGEGHTHAIAVEGFPLSSPRWLRIGLGFDTGFRVLEHATDWATRFFASLGIQYPWRVTPYGSVNVGGGVVYRKRFAQNITDGMWAFGADVGATFRISTTFVADLCLGYLYMSFDDLGFHSFTLRVSIGW